MNMENIIITILSSAVVSSIVSTLIAPHVNWGIEKKKIKTESRKNLIKEVRAALSIAEFSRDDFQKTEIYTRIRPYFSNKLTKEIDSDAIIIVTGTNLDNDDFIKRQINEELLKLEEKWEII